MNCYYLMFEQFPWCPSRNQLKTNKAKQNKICSIYFICKSNKLTKIKCISAVGRELNNRNAFNEFQQEKKKYYNIYYPYTWVEISGSVKGWLQIQQAFTLWASYSMVCLQVEHYKLITLVMLQQQREWEWVKSTTLLSFTCSLEKKSEIS